MHLVDLEERSGRHCGPGLPTPTAQCLGQHIFEHAVYPYDSSKISLSEIHQLGQEFNASLKAIDIAGEKGILPEELSFCRVKGALASAYKKAEYGDDVILRLYNISDYTSQTEIEFFRSITNVTEVTLSEVPVTQPLPLKVSANEISLNVPAKKLVTFRLNLQEERHPSDEEREE
jgi:alpha-mannosidase/mannosylglycerate hydrolase